MKEDHRSEPQEWTHEKLQGLLGINNEDRYVADHVLESTLDEINTALAAERQRFDKNEAQWIKDWNNRMSQLCRLNEELTIERQATAHYNLMWDTACKCLATHRQQLLSAQAAIQERKPLLDLLAEIKVFLNRYRNGVIQHAEATELAFKIDALAKGKL